MAKIKNVQVAILFEIDESIIFTLGDSIKKLQKNVKAQVQILNTPSGARPEAPRVIIFTPDYVINISLNRIDIVFNIPSHIEDKFDNVIAFCYKSFENIYEKIIEGYINYKWAGVIFDVNYSSNLKKIRSIELMTPVFDHLLNLKRKERKLASFNLQYGYEENAHFINYNISGYESITLKLPAPNVKGEMIEIGVTEDDIDETGILIKVDINNQPLLEKSDIITDFSKILDLMRSSLENILHETNLREIVNE